VELRRRDALKLLATGLAATLASCGKPEEEIIPYVEMPERMAAGVPLRFATSLPLSGYGRGFLAISVDGRPIKIEGNPRHPYSRGATDIFAEAAVLSLYDPDRSPVPQHDGIISSWDAFLAQWHDRTASAGDGKGMALVTGRILSPTTLRAIDEMKKRFPALRWYRYEPVNDDHANAGMDLAFGRSLALQPRLADADVVLSLWADPLGPGPEQLRHAHAFSTRRGGVRPQRIHVAEPAWTLTGAMADCRIAAGPAILQEIGRAIANRLGADLGEAQLDAQSKAFADSAAHDLLNARGHALALIGEAMPPGLHALGHWLNARLDAPIDHLPAFDPVTEGHGASLTALAEDLRERRVTTLILADVNPVYDAPDAFDMAEAIAAVPFSLHLGCYRDETAASCRWHLPLSHALESWADLRAADGTASIVQPLIQRLYDTRTCDEVFSLLAGRPGPKAYDLVRASWMTQAGGDFESWWRRVLEAGLIEDSAPAPVNVSSPRLPQLGRQDRAATPILVLSPDPSLWDGRFANNAWLQECAKPFTKEVWGNAVQLAPADADKLGLKDADKLGLTRNGRSLEAAIIRMPGQAAGVMAASWGLGRDRAGQIGSHVGTRFAGFSDKPFERVLAAVDIAPLGEAGRFVSTREYTELHGRAEELFPVLTLQAFRSAAPNPEPAPPSLLPPPQKGIYAWAMVIDTDACIGCNACVLACQAENNVPVVGPEEIALGRDMHWLRVDIYARDEQQQERRGFQPIPCMHCELAPCEPVCPVAASVHDHEGLNVQVYNRCIGTRFCEANCPYKVRRFNWYAYAGDQAYGNQNQPPLKAQRNPDVSVRGRGVMEKCNYCLQRISHARRHAEKENRTVDEGEVVTACQAACPTRAIHFGDLNHPNASVTQLRASPRHYELLAELNTRPRTTYLKRLYNVDED
jgi:molybdopterin-containing oxidoreductase family iron-sulfur binding subunit